MVDPAILAGPRLKVERAYRHIDEIRSLTEPLSRALYEITFDEYSIIPKFKDRGIYAHYTPKKPIPETLALTIGDAIHNLRSALDHLAIGICRTIEPKARAHFPVHPDRKHLITDSTLALIEKALPGSSDLFLNELRPENGPNESLWRFNDLSNKDKHNHLIPTVIATKIEGVKVHIEGGGLIAGGFYVFDGAEPFEIFGISRARPLSIECDPEITVEVVFAEGTPFQGETVVPTLVQVADLVTKTLDAFERLIRA